VRLCREEPICGAFECPTKSSSGRGQAAPPSLNAKDKFGFTALMYVKEEGHKQIVRILKEGHHSDIHLDELFPLKILLNLDTTGINELGNVK
jgi:hypothetical protein